MLEAYPFLSGQEMCPKPLVGISACLSGENVRYDGRSKGQPDLLNALSARLGLLNLCPEVAIGMGVPRAPIQLCCDSGKIEAIAVDNPNNIFTQPLQVYAEQVIAEHSSQPDAKKNLCGFIFKSRSPSCGVASTPVYREEVPARFADGIFTCQIKMQLPWLPVVEEEDLKTTNAIDLFVLLVYLVNDFHHVSQQKEGLRQFHSHHSALLAILSCAVQTRLSLVADTPSVINNPQLGLQRYLSVLINDLQTTSYQAFKTISR